MDFAKREKEQLDSEIEALQEKIRLRNVTKTAWSTIMHSAENQSNAATLDLANTEIARLNQEIEAVQEEIHRFIETRDAWDLIVRNVGSETRVNQSVTYVKGEDGRWHLQRLEKEIEALQVRIRLRNEIKAAWDTVGHNTVGKRDAAFLDLASSETTRLNEEIEAVQQEISRRIETRDAWATIIRNSIIETHVYKGATYMKGWDGQWHMQQITPAFSKLEEERRWTENTVSKVHSVGQALLDACEKTLLNPPKHVNHSIHGKEPLQSLGLS
jgi:hypothetical protein